MLVVKQHNCRSWCLVSNVLSAYKVFWLCIWIYIFLIIIQVNHITTRTSVLPVSWKTIKFRHWRRITINWKLLSVRWVFNFVLPKQKLKIFFLLPTLTIHFALSQLISTSVTIGIVFKTIQTCPDGEVWEMFWSLHTVQKSIFKVEEFGVLFRQ